MPAPRYAVLAALIAAGAPASAKAPAPKTWANLIQHVLKHGGNWPLKAPMTRTLGYDSDLVPAKSLGIEQAKSKDDREHSIFVVYEADKGIPRATEVVLANLQVTMKDGSRFVDGYDVRATLDGKIIGGMRALGAVGKVVQTPIKADAAELKTVFAEEREMFLNKLDWKRLSAE